MKNKIKYSRSEIEKLTRTCSDIEEITDSYQKIKFLFTIGTLLGALVAIAMNIGLPDEAFNTFLKLAMITPIVVLCLLFKVLNKMQNEDIHDYLEDVDY